MKHRNHQNSNDDRLGIDGKEKYIKNENEINHNIYSTNSTRTNSTTDKNMNETGTIITRSGSTESPRSSTSSFPAYLDNSNSPGPNGSLSQPNIEHRISSRHSSMALFQEGLRSPFYNGSIFDDATDAMNVCPIFEKEKNFDQLVR
ncbi:hypothetical protein QR98_0097840 [Sarcoptes scabiei]|uniref:Uncharacterized protein n=1 Tax=Sarcoptes scabiei TaxID=52283 RepID=A0A132AJQ0_SARSC|nr:hypothetical protein QR98_0097840 [Sarcoptes scabiei]